MKVKSLNPEIKAEDTKAHIHSNQGRGEAAGSLMAVITYIKRKKCSK